LSWVHLRAESTRASLDRAVSEILGEERQRARRLIEENRGILVALRDLLLEKKVLEASAFAELTT
jgi:cell division protease FtsH